MFLKEKAIIGMVAPSCGVKEEPYRTRYQNAVLKIRNLGYQIKEAPSIYEMRGLASNTKEKRALEFMDMYLDEDVDILFSVGGGEVMFEILPFIDFELLKTAKKKLFIGYSDNTNLTFPLTTICNNISLYAYNAPTLGMEKWDFSIENLWSSLKGEKEFSSYDKYEIISKRDENPLDGFNKTEDVAYLGECDIKGVMLGGCIDVLDYICGTKYDNVKKYIQDKKIIWYFDNCELTPLRLKRTLWKFKEAGWFTNAVGFIFGRSMNQTEEFGCTYDSVIQEELKGKTVVINADIGHLPPTMPIFNGREAHIIVHDGKGKIIYE